MTTAMRDAAPAARRPRPSPGSLRRGVPGSRSRARPAHGPARGAAAHEGRNENPAVGPLRELVDDRILGEGTRYEDAIAGLEEVRGRRATRRRRWHPGVARGAAAPRPATRRRRSPASSATSVITGVGCSALSSTPSSAASISRSGSWRRRSTRSISGSAVRRTAARCTPRRSGAGRRAGALLGRLRVDAAARAHGQEHYVCGSTSCRASSAGTSGRSTPCPMRRSTRSPRGA